uniref:Uncharacterized protein n=2 Tax=Aegilops tauschii subsp. strangulata TaxID=200361 RepID=A0A453F0Z8_AEGTS
TAPSHGSSSQHLLQTDAPREVNTVFTGSRTTPNPQLTRSVRSRAAKVHAAAGTPTMGLQLPLTGPMRRWPTKSHTDEGSGQGSDPRPTATNCRQRSTRPWRRQPPQHN